VHKSKHKKSVTKSPRAQQGPARKASSITPTFDLALPINQRREELQDAIEANQVVIVCGETGSGKSTQIPKMCLALGRGTSGLVGHTQPRRIAARSIASRLTAELGTTNTSVVGYKIRFEDRTDENTLIKVVTDGMLLSEIRGDRSLRQYDTIIIDEAHERSLNIDFLLGYLKQLLPRRPDLKLIITSATIDPASFSSYFNDAPVIEVSGRMFPVETRYRPSPEGPGSTPLPIQVGNAVAELTTEARDNAGDILVFLPGERDIRDSMEYLQKLQLPHTEVLPLYGRLAMHDQRRIFSSHSGRRIVLATNVAETSLTVPGIRWVIDSGLVRASRYSTARQVQRLPIEPVSQASAEQRKGRCGRVESGICVRLYSEEDFANRSEFTEPEVLRTSLAAVLLTMLDLDFGEIQSFPFLDPPPPKAVNDGVRLLQELGAVNEKRRLTAAGKRLASFPVDPRIARMLQAGAETGCLTEVLVIASFLSTQDPREYPQNALDSARNVHKQWEVENSDFLTVLTLWNAWQRTRKSKTNRQGRDWLRQHFLSFQRMREWVEIHRQIHELCTKSKMLFNEDPASEEKIHRALLAGLLGNIAMKDERHEYLGTRGKRMFIHPGSATFKKPPKWLMAAELVDTTRLYARMVAVVQPEWVESWAGELVNKSYSNPHWSKKQSRVLADEQISLFGLILIQGRVVQYGSINPRLSRELFIRRGLVEGDYASPGKFLEHNHRLVSDLENLEHRTRKKDILADEDLQYQFYDSRVPEGIADGNTFEQWRAIAEQEMPRLLLMEEQDLLIRSTDDVTTERFPDNLVIENNRLPLNYHFEPGHANDGVSCSIPVTLLRQIAATPFEWLVPGLILEKIISMIKLLPKPLRRQCVPAPDVAVKCLDYIHTKSILDLPLTEALARALSSVTPVVVRPEELETEGLASHLRMNFRIIDDDAVELAGGRDLDKLKQQLGAHARQVFEATAEETIERGGLRTWDFEELPEAVRLKRGGITLAGYPALVDHQETVSIRLFDNPVEADEAGRSGIRRLFMLDLSAEVRYLRKNLHGLDRMALSYITMGSKSDLGTDIVNATIDQCFEITDSAVRTRLEYQERRHHGKPRIMPVANKLCTFLDKILREYVSIIARLDSLPGESRNDIRTQLVYLLHPGFVTATPDRWMRRYPMYFKAINERIERADYAPEKDLQKLAEVKTLADTLEDYYEVQWKSPEQAKKFTEFRWLLEEFRISIFAQRIKTVASVSRSKLQKLADDVTQTNH
jgi:ATP-dependent helicase HrpA